MIPKRTERYLLRLLAAAFVCLLYFARGAWNPQEAPPAHTPASSSPEAYAIPGAPTRTVERVIDGDSLVFSGGEEARLIGVDTPEFGDWRRNRRNAKRLGIPYKPYGSYAQKSKDFLRALLLRKAVAVTRDGAGTAKGSIDKYGRTLVYVWLDEAGVPAEAVTKWRAAMDEAGIPGGAEKRLLVNAVLVAEGYSYAYTRFPFEFREAFTRLEALARKRRAGYWRSADPML